MILLFMGKLINGGEVGLVIVIGNDYQVLEFKGVVRIILVKGGMFIMRLLKLEVGRLVLLVI